MSEEISNKQIFEAIVGMKSDIVALQSTVTVLGASVKDLNESVVVLNERFDGLATHMDTSIAESEHRTKDFVERRIAAAVEEIVSPMRKIDTKDTALVEELAEKSIISPKESARITALSPFPAI